MTGFKFNFSGEANSSESKDDNDIINWHESVEVIPEDQIVNFDHKVSRAKMFTCGDIEIGHLHTSDAVANIKETGFKNSIELAEKEHSDLVAGAYEGGLKIWECTYDLVEFLEENTCDYDYSNKKVLDLGCGAGILGIYAFLKGAEVTFQDYNKEVLEYMTIPNVLLNIEEESEREDKIKKCKFYSGDWESFNKKLPECEVYDYILTSETIYNHINYDKLVSLFTDRLSKDGCVFVAAKTHYFGVGGGIKQFEEAIETNKQLKSNVCWKSTGGIQREILKISHNNQS